MIMTTRGALKDDCKTVYKFICELEDTEFIYSDFEQYYFRNIDDPDIIYLVAEHQGNVIGFLSCHGQYLLHHMEKVWEIQELFVHEQYRSKKAGQVLIETIEDILLEKNYRYLEVASNIKRTDAHRFYLKNGFGQTHYRFTKMLY